MQDNFDEWGPIERIYNVASKTIAFVQYYWRASAEFAKEAMQVIEFTTEHCVCMQLSILTVLSPWFALLQPCRSALSAFIWHATCAFMLQAILHCMHSFARQFNMICLDLACISAVSVFIWHAYMHCLHLYGIQVCNVYIHLASFLYALDVSWHSKLE